MTKINPSDYSPPNVNYWGDRCCKAEAEVKKLRTALEEIAKNDFGYQRGYVEIARKALEG